MRHFNQFFGTKEIHQIFFGNLNIWSKRPFEKEKKTTSHFHVYVLSIKEYHFQEVLKVGIVTKL